MSTGMNFEQVLDQLDLPSLAGFTAYWESHPPVHIMVAAYFGIEPKASATTAPRANDDAVLASLMSAFAPTPTT